MDTKIADLTTLTPVDNADWTVVVDVSDTTDGPDGTTKKAARSEFKGDTGGTGAAGADAFVYIAYASADDGTDFTTTFDADLDYIAIKSSTTEIASPAAADFSGLWKNYKGTTGATGSTGAAGANAFVYIAYASDDSGTDFTTTFDAALDYIAILSTDTEIASPAVGDFAGLWKNYKGAIGAQGPQGEQGEAGSGTGDMLASTYDPNSIGDDAFSMDNMVEGTNTKILTAAERTKLSNTSGNNTGDQTSVTGNAGTATKLATARTIDGQSFDGSANVTVIAPGTHAATGKTTPADADEVPIVDSAASNALKKLTWANLKATLKTYLDTLYQAAGSYVTTGSTITLAENTSIALDPAGSADGKYTGITIAATAGYTQSFGDLVYLDPTDSRWELADANSASAADGDARGILGMVLVAGTDGNACTILLQGVIRADAKFPTFTINSPVYVSETAGAVTQTQPTTADVVIRIVGSALTADEMYSNPDRSWITHT